MTFGKNLQTLRLQAGLSQSGLATKTGIPVKTIQGWEINRRTPRWIDLLVRLARGLDVSLEQLAAGAAPSDESGAKAEGKVSPGRPRQASSKSKTPSVKQERPPKKG
jgi:transcriptional regulator with XRE-family HTH domain